MSSVLKALKKIENDSYGNTRQSLHSAVFLSSSNTGYAKIIGIVCIIIIIATAAYFLITPTPNPLPAGEGEFKGEDGIIKQPVQNKQQVQKTQKPAVKTSKNPLPTVNKNEELKLQAVSWSEIPRKRVAVINNKVVREKQSIGSGVLHKIEKNYVIIVSGNQKRILKFNEK